LVREALLRSARGCAEQPTSDCRRLLAGRLNVQGAVSFLYEPEALATGERPSLTSRPSLTLPARNSTRKSWCSQLRLSPSSKGVLPMSDISVESTSDVPSSATSVADAPMAAPEAIALEAAIPAGVAPASSPKVQASACSCPGVAAGPRFVYALGRIGYD